MRGDFIRWMSVAGVALVDVVLAYYLEIRIVIGPYFAALVVWLALIYLVYRKLRPNHRLAQLCSVTSQYLALGCVLTILSCLVVAFNFSLVDDALARADEAMGFNWIRTFEFVHERSWLAGTLTIFYNSIAAQTGLLFLWLNAIDRIDRVYEFISLFALTLAITVAISLVVPASGAFVQYGADRLVDADYVQLFAGIRDGSIRELPLSAIDGIVQFPSFHTTLAILLTYAARNVRFLFPIMACANALMLASTPIFGGHYLSDMLAGAAVTILTILFVNARGSDAARDAGEDIISGSVAR